MNRLEKIIFTVSVLIISIGFFSINVYGADDKKIHIQANASAEQEFVKDVKNTLDGMGYDNAGISLTKQVNEAGTLEYTLFIHHRRIDKMDELQRNELSAIIIGDGIKANNCKVKAEYIEYM